MTHEHRWEPFGHSRGDLSLGFVGNRSGFRCACGATARREFGRMVIESESIEADPEQVPDTLAGEIEP